MTPVEKAREMFDKIHYQICKDCGLSSSDSTEISAKMIALITVDEIMNALDNVVGPTGGVKYFWQQVKEEIQKM